MNFGEALEMAKRGRLVSREGWNGKNMFIFIGFPKVNVNAKSKKHGMVYTDASETFGCNYSGPVLCMKSAQEEIVVGWMASQTDMLSSDWIEIGDLAKQG